LQGEYVSSANHLKTCLRIMGRPLAETRVDVVASLAWNVFRQLMHRLRVGLWLGSGCRRFLGRVTEEESQMSARDAALVYHGLHELASTGTN
jgi:sterol regulatory element-binding transcription factor 1